MKGLFVRRFYLLLRWSEKGPATEFVYYIYTELTYIQIYHQGLFTKGHERATSENDA